MPGTAEASDGGAAIGRLASRAVAVVAVRSLALGGGGIAVILAAATVLDTPAWASWDFLLEAAIALGLLATIGGVGGLFHAVRMGLCLLRWPWVSRHLRFKELSIPFIGSEQPCLVLDGEHVLTVPTWRWRWRALESYDHAHVWFCGPPERSGAVFLPAEGRALWARHILIPPLRTAFRRRVLGVRGSGS